MKLKILATLFCLATVSMVPVGAKAGISLDPVIGLWNTDTLECGVPVELRLRWDGSGIGSGNSVTGSSNGFRLYDNGSGAVWSYPLGNTVGGQWNSAVDWSAFYDGGFFTNIFPEPLGGVISDTIGFGGFRLFKSGIPDTINEIFAIIQVLPDCNSHRKELCIDSSWYAPSNPWKWSATGGQTNYKPSWDGPHCFTIFNPNAPPDLVVTPDSLSFDAVSGGTPPPIQTLNIGSSGASVDFSLTKTAVWLNLVPASGNTPQSVTVSVTTGLGAGTYYDTIQVTSTTGGNSPVLVPVRLTLAPPPPVIATDKDSVGFVAFEGGPNPADQMVSVTNSGGGTLSFSVSTTGTWLSAAISTADTVVLSANNATLTVGTYHDTLVITDPAASNSPFRVPVTFDIVTPPVIVVDTNYFYFEDTVNGTPPPQQLTITNNGGSPWYLTLTNSQSWLTVAPDQGPADPFTTSLSINPAGLGVGTYNDTVWISEDNATNSPVAVVVAFKIVSDLTVSPTALTFAILAGGAPETQAIEVLETSGAQVNYTLSESAPWMSLNQLAGVTPDTVDVTVDPTGLLRATYLDSIQVVAVEKGGPKYVRVTLDVLNNPPVLDPVADTSVSHRGSLTLNLSASDPDSDTLTFFISPAVANMTFDTTTGQLSFVPAVDQVGDYNMTAYVTDGIDTDSVSFLISVTFECNEMSLSDTLFEFEYNTAFFGVPLDDQFLTVTSDYTDFCFTLAPNTGATWLVLTPDTSCTDYSPVALNIDTTGLVVDTTYEAMVAVIGDETVCAPNHQFIRVQLNVFYDPVVVPEDPDSLMVGTAAAVPGAQTVVPVSFANLCALTEISAVLGWDGAGDILTLDSAVFSDSRVGYLYELNAAIDNDLNTVAIDVVVNSGEALIDIGSGSLVDLYFSVAVGSSPGFYYISTGHVPGDPPAPNFTRDCGSGPIPGVPVVDSGGVVIDGAVNYVCGYVVDPDGLPVGGATVELWSSFPGGTQVKTTTTNGSGAFGMADSSGTFLFDLYAHHRQYYPNTKDSLTFSSIPRNIVLTPLNPLPDTLNREWVDYHCVQNSYYEVPLPVGSIVEAIDEQGVLCGQFYVDSAGEYGHMLVYRDDPGTALDEGATTGDILRFFVNGTEALTTGDVNYPSGYDFVEVCLEAGVSASGSCPINAGWNLISWNLDTESDDVEDVFANLGSCVEVVLGFEQGGLTWTPDLPRFSTLKQVDHLSGYWLKSTCDTVLNLNGLAVPVTTPIPVTPGWNLVSYLPAVSMSTPDALGTIHGDLIQAFGFENDTGYTYIPTDPGHSTLSTMKPCLGYWVKVYDQGVLRYPGIGPVYTLDPNAPVAFKAEQSDVIPTNRWVNLYSGDLSLDGEVVSVGATVTAHSFSNGTKIGSFEVTSEGSFGFMPVYADDPTTSEIEGVGSGDRFYLKINGMETEQSFTWTGSGDRIEVHGLTSKGTSEGSLPGSYSLDQNYPNPFNPATTISFNMPVSGRAKIEVFNILGKLVAVPFDGVADVGSNQVIWDARGSTGSKVASGIYFYRLTADNYSETRKMTLLK